MKIEKNKIVIWLGLIICFFLFQSFCDNHLNLNTFKNETNKKYCAYSKNPIWKVQLDDFIKNDTLYLEKSFKVIDYKCVKFINSEKELENIKIQIINDNKYFPVENNTRKYGLREVQLNKKDFKVFLDMVLPTTLEQKQLVPSITEKKSSITPYLLEKNDMILIKINWLNNGKKIRTRCIVSSKRGILFDEFLSYIGVTTMKK